MERLLQSTSVADELRAFILETFLPGESETTLLDDDLLIEGGIIDSGSVMELVAFLEERYELRVADDDLVLENFATIGALARFVGVRVKRPCGSS
ncbi:MAG TPA: acyl carrier protein [Candidatus Eisenbacteria bacterium]|nr:acyl carrier protein [Candidatus Eisenbacteria bacterium]